MPEPTNLLGLPRGEMREFFSSLGEKPFRADQVLKWIHHRHTASFGAMTDLGKGVANPARYGRGNPRAGGGLRSVLRGRNPQVALQGRQRQLRGDGLHPRRSPRHAVRLLAGRVRAELHFLCDRAAGLQPDLHASEIIGQLWAVTRILASSGHPGPEITNVVLMGMGEPLLNLENVVPSLELMLDDLGFGLARSG